MSLVADANAMSQNIISVPSKKNAVFIRKAPVANAVPMTHCMVMLHHRLVRMMSMNGLHSGLITHGRYIRLVKNAFSIFGMPRFSYMVTDITTTMKYGSPERK